MSNKPPAGTTTGSATEWYLAAVLDELKKLNGALNPAPVAAPDASGRIEIKEPAKRKTPAKRSATPKKKSGTTKAKP